MSQPPLVLLPGLTCDQAVWADQIAALSATAACLVPAYGELDSLPAMAQAVLRQAPPLYWAGFVCHGRAD